MAALGRAENADAGELILRTYEAALEPDCWEVLLPDLIGFTGGRRGLVALRDASSVPWMVLCDMDSAREEQWRRDFGCIDPLYERVGCLTTGQLVASSRVLPRQEFERTALFNECWGPGGIADWQTVCLESDGVAYSYFSTYRGPGEGELTPAAFARLKHLGPHLVRAAAIQSRFVELQRKDAARERLVAMLPFGVVALDERGRVLFANDCGERLLLTRHAATTALAPAVTRAIESLRGRGEPSTGVVRIARAERRAVQVLVAPITQRAAFAAFPFAPRSAVLLVASDPDAAPILAETALRTTFALTPALSRLAAALAAGKTLAEYADEAHVTVGTARVQLKELFARTGTSRQAELARVLLTSVAALARGAD